jgi:hypothetical protein
MDRCFDIASVAELKNLVELEIIYGDISDSDSLKRLTKLRTLILHACNINNVDFISYMPLLSSINFAKNNISEIKALQGLKHIETVEIWENKIKDLSPLKDLVTIRVLDISSNPICWDSCKLSDLKCLPYIKKIGLYGLATDYIQIKKAHNLKEIHLGGIELEDIAFISSHQNIESISLTGSSVREISSLTKLPKLKEVWMGGNEKIEDYSPIHQLRTKGIEVYMDGWEINKNFVELHLHTCYSKRGSVIRPEALARTLSEVEAEAVAITDFNTVAAFPEADLFLHINNIRIIFGLETSTEEGSITLLAKNQDGLNSLYYLSSRLSDKDSVVEKKEIFELRKGLLLGSGNEYGELVQAIQRNKDWEELKSISGIYDYLEVMPIFTMDTVNIIIKLGEEMNIPVCAVSDARFINREDEVLLREISGNKTEYPRYLRDHHGKRSAFSYLQKQIQDKIIIENPQKVIGEIEDVELDYNLL